jgi:hypothetical protein
MSNMRTFGMRYVVSIRRLPTREFRAGGQNFNIGFLGFNFFRIALNMPSSHNCFLLFVDDFIPVTVFPAMTFIIPMCCIFLVLALKIFVNLARNAFRACKMPEPTCISAIITYWHLFTPFIFGDVGTHAASGFA